MHDHHPIPIGRIAESAMQTRHHVVTGLLALGANCRLSADLFLSRIFFRIDVDDIERTCGGHLYDRLLILRPNVVRMICR